MPAEPRATGAVFLSYASQDAEAAKRIADALRASGVEVWFDQSELVGGDAWDAKIRTQIADCALFVPVISAATQARLEGYFRIEWKLAAQRTHAMADEKAFLLPVVIDEMRDADAKVPAEFRAVQWTRLPAGAAPEGFCARVRSLLDGGSSSRETASSASPAPASRELGPPRKHFRPWLGPAAVGTVVIAAFAVWRPWQEAKKPAVVVPAALSAGAVELARVRAQIIPDRWQKEDFDAVSSTLDRLLQANPEESDAWALRSIVNSLQALRNFDPGTKSLEIGKSAADRALRLSPGSPLAELARGMHLTAMISRGGDPRAARPFIDRAVAALPPDALTRFADVALRLFGYDFAGVDRAGKAWLQTEPDASYPQWILAIGYLANRHLVEAEEWSGRAAGNRGNTGSRALGTLFAVKFFLRADLEAARAVLDRVSADGRSVHRIVYFRWLLAMAEHHWDAALQVLAQVPEPVIGDVVYHGPKALLAGQAHQRAGRPEAAASQFAEAERQLRDLLVHDADNEELHAVLALTLASEGRGPEARGELGLIEPLIKQRPATAFRSTLVELIAETHGVLGDFDDAAFWLRKLFTEPSNFPFTPASVRFDPRFAGTLNAPPVRALLAEFAGLDQAAVAPTAADKSVAVLAFANLSDDKGNEYFSDGISEELLNVLAKIPGLKVTARTSSFHFKGMNTAIPEIARQLGVAYVVEGSVRKQGDRVRITAQLIKAADGFHVWSDTFTRDLKDIFAVQDEIAGLIATNLSLRLGMDRSVSGRATVPEAFELYLEGRAAWNLRTREGYARAESLLSRAIDLDPGFARAHAALADVWSIAAYESETDGGTYGWRNSSTVAKIAAKAEQAVALDPNSAEAYTSLALALEFGWKWEAAEQAYQRAIELNPNYATARHWYGMMLWVQGKMDEALQQLKQAAESDPLSHRILDIYARMLNQAGRPGEALAVADRALALQPLAIQAATQKAHALVLLDRAGEAVALIEKVLTLSPNTEQRTNALHILQLAGAEAVMRRIIGSIEELPASQFKFAGLVALGRPDEALAELRPADLHENQLINMAVFQFYDPVREDPRFLQAISDVGYLEDYRRARGWLAAHAPEKPGAK